MYVELYSSSFFYDWASPRGGAESGGRTHTPGEGNGILSPARLPVPPFRHAVFACAAKFTLFVSTKQYAILSALLINQHV